MSNNLIQTADPNMKKVLDIVDNVAGSKATVLIQGESGTGKELLARYIHSKSIRSSKPFHAINCAAVPDTLLESELFGFERGAFTGADKLKIGKFEQAHGSTFLLDEISEMPVLLQAKLLRVLQEGEVQRLGGGAPKKVDVRMVATTNRNLMDMVQSNNFREDLYYRLNVIPLFVPPLRDRPKDLDLLSQLFLDTACAEHDLPMKKFDESARRKIHDWKWPGNVRELQNVIERSVLLVGGDVLKADQILINDFEESKKSNNFRPGMTVAEAERMLILKTLEYTSQNRTHAADMLGISIRTLRNKLREYRSIDPAMVTEPPQLKMGGLR